MRFEETRNLAPELKKRWDYTNDFRRRPEFSTALDHMESGDRVRFTQKLLCQRIEGSATIEQREEGSLAHFTANSPDSTQEWHHTNLDDHFILRVVLDVNEATSFLGRFLDGTALPKALGGDLTRTMDNLEDILKVGIATK